MREDRIERDIFQERLGELAKVHRTYVGMIERGEKNITHTNIEKFAHALGLSVKELFKNSQHSEKAFLHHLFQQ